MMVPSGPADYKNLVEQTWHQVSKTMSKGTSKKLVVKRSGWKTVRVFVSSTFKDFHAEREVLVKEVCISIAHGMVRYCWLVIVFRPWGTLS